MKLEEKVQKEYYLWMSEEEARKLVELFTKPEIKALYAEIPRSLDYTRIVLYVDNGQAINAIVRIKDEEKGLVE